MTKCFFAGSFKRITKSITVRLCLLILVVFVSTAWCEDSDDVVPDITLGEEYSGYNKIGPTGKHTATSTRERPIWKAVLWYLPNRFLDILDVVKVDVGVGPAVGLSLRATKYAQLGARTVFPASVRVGLMGRRAPAMIESSNEFGVSPVYTSSPQRQIGKGEIGASADLLLLGLSAGVDMAEIPDFLAGIVGIDLSKDDE